MRVVLIANLSESTPRNVREIVDAMRAATSDGRMDLVNVALELDARRLEEVTRKAHAVVVHNTASYFPAKLQAILADCHTSSRDTLIVMKQDEHVEPLLFDEIFSDFGVREVFTCLRAPDVATVYPRALQAGTRFTRMYTGYVTSRLLRTEPAPLMHKPYRLTYRGSMQPVWLGRLGRDKALIPQLAYARLNGKTSDWLVDASSQWKDRLYGDAWDDFLRSSHAVLGSESGSNVFDLDGQLRRRTREFELRHGPLSWESTDLYAQYESEVLTRYEGRVKYATIAPRHLEAALWAKPQVLTEGEYEGIFIDGVNCLTVDSGMLRLPQALAEFEDSTTYARLSRAAHESVADNPTLRVECLVEDLNKAIERVSEQSARDPHRLSGVATSDDVRPMADSRGPYSAVLVPVRFERDPRHLWWAQSLRARSQHVEVWEFDAAHSRRTGPRSGLALVPQNEWEAGIPIISTSSTIRDALAIIAAWLRASWEHPAVALVGALYACAGRTPNSITDSQARLFLRHLAALLGVPSSATPDLIVANDLQTAFAAAVAFRATGCFLVYDAQESFADMLRIAEPAMREDEFEMWVAVDNYAMTVAHRVVSMTPGLSGLALRRAGVHTDVIPNFAPSSDAATAAPRSGPPIRFIFMGNAAPRRGLEELISTWDIPALRAELHLYIPASDHLRTLRRLATKPANGGARVVFHAAVPERDMISTLAAYDVGVVPYDYPYPYNHCSPNKLGQYAAAGLAILASDLPFVSQVIAENRLGLVFSWRDPEGLGSAVARMLIESDLRVWQENSARAARSRLNWESVSSGFVADVLGRHLPVRATDFVDRQPLGVTLRVEEDQSLPLRVYARGDITPELRRRPRVRAVWSLVAAVYDVSRKIPIVRGLAGHLSARVRRTAAGSFIYDQMRG